MSRFAVGSRAAPDEGVTLAAQPDDRDLAPGRPDDVRTTVRWASVVFVVGVALLLAALLWQTQGTFVYVVDDAAIHLTVARRLALDGTWGIVPGEFQAASSSPLWTLLLAPTQLVVRGTAGEWVPLVLNVAAGLWVVRLLGPELHRVLRPGTTRPLDLAAVAAIVTALLFLPALAFFGMEHTLHLALVLAATLAVERRWADGSALPAATPPDWLAAAGTLPNGGGTGEAAVSVAGADRRLDAVDRPAPPLMWVPFVLLGLATLVRFETAFVAVGLAAGVLAVRVRSQAAQAGAGRAGEDPTQRDGDDLGPVDAPPAWRACLPVVAGLGLAVAATLASVAAVNLAFGQGLLPNSVAAKALGDRGDTRRSIAAAFERLTTDPLLLAFFLLALATLVIALRARHRAGPAATVSPALFPAAVMVVATLLHVELGAVTASLRYEAYLLGLGVLVLLRALPGGRAWAERRAPRLGARLGAAGLVLLLVPVAALHVYRTVTVPRQARVLWEQRYQVARFLDRAYDTQSIAIGELGYIGLYHDGPLTDVYGLGDHEVLEAALDGRKDADFWRELQARRGFTVVATYDFSIAGQRPAEWFPVASWRSPDAFYEVTEFWATTPDEVLPLRRALEAYEPHLPDDVEVFYNDLAPLAAATQATPAG